MRFDDSRYGVFAVVWSPADHLAEPHYSIVLRMNFLRRVSDEEVEITRGLPGPETRDVLLAIRHTCDRAIAFLDENEGRTRAS